MGVCSYPPAADFKSNLVDVLNDILPGMILFSLSTVFPMGGFLPTGYPAPTVLVTVPVDLPVSMDPVLAVPGFPHIQLICQSPWTLC